jgi:hypothetical protein
MTGTGAKKSKGVTEIHMMLTVMYGAVLRTYLGSDSSCHAVVSYEAYVLRFVFVRYGHIPTPWYEVHHLGRTMTGTGKEG